MNKTICTGQHPKHDHALQEAQLLLPQQNEVEALSMIYKLFADSTRLKIITALLSGELCVCELTELIGATQSAVSHQLRLLKSGRLVRARREGKQIYYSLDDAHIHSIISCGLEHIREGE